MMNGYPSISQALRQAGPAAGQCRCQQRCVCRAGQPCSCSSGCTCSHASAAPAGHLRTRNWIESGESEMPRRTPPATTRSAWLRHRARNMLQQRQARQDDWRRRARLNGMFARRFNWGPQLGRVSRAIGSPYAQPDSRRFMFALARWQQRQGLPPNGILSPGMWRRLLAMLQAAAVPAATLTPGGWTQAPGDGAFAGSASGPQPDPVPPDSAADDAALPLPGDAGEPAPEGNEFASAYGFRSRRVYAY